MHESISYIKRVYKIHDTLPKKIALHLFFVACVILPFQVGTLLAGIFTDNHTIKSIGLLLSLNIFLMIPELFIARRHYNKSKEKLHRLQTEVIVLETLRKVLYRDTPKKK